MGLNYAKWKHVTKLDPAKDISKEKIRQIIDAGTDAIMVSGTLGITKKNIAELRKKITGDIPVILEPNSPEVVSYDDFDAVFVPSVLNGSKEYLIGKHIQWVANYNIEWDKIVPVAYIVMNPNCAVAKLTNACTDLKSEEAVALAQVAEKYFGFSIIYYEMSGKFGDPEKVGSVRSALNTPLFYGGGINNREKAIAMSEHATIVVGNAFYENFDRALETII